VRKLRQPNWLCHPPSGKVYLTDPAHSFFQREAQPRVIINKTAAGKASLTAREAASRTFFRLPIAD